MKKVLSSFIIIILCFILSCCNTENTRKETIKGEPLSDGTATYYINEKNDSEQLLHSTRYDENDNVIEEYEFKYSYDLNGRIVGIRKTDVETGKCYETVYDRFKTKTEEITYSSNGVIIDKKDFLKNGCVKKAHIYNGGNETGYIIYDYYTDNQVKNETEYDIGGRAVKMTTYYKNRLLYQIKDFDKEGMICKITKYSYKGDVLIKESLFDADFNLYQVTDFSKSPPNVTRYKNGEPIK
ncbi:MAG: hypothetical protein MJ147_02505 [Clostridia bacterium]|nr:hypothetical protein [Clostridia bacterium]